MRGSCTLSSTSQRSAPGGAIITISSVGGVTAAAGNWTYHAAKSAVVFFARCAALDVGAFGVPVDCIAPSAMPCANTSKAARR
ncbi:MAG: SDR family NAD(P)-dependent oxidoreductase [Sphingomonadales bacterium]|nr:SDR family NAD(P)-dependent oxidoreductase [Sphingomonadales bacterium]